MSRTHVALALALAVASGLASAACSEKEDTKDQLDAERKINEIMDLFGK